MECNVLNYTFTQILLIVFLLSIYSHKGSIGSLLMARAAIKFYWVLSSTSGLLSPTDSDFVQKFVKGLNCEKNILNPPVKAYPLSYLELEQLFIGVCRGGMFINQPFVKQRFIAMLILSYSVFTRFEEIQGLLVEQFLILIQLGFSWNI